MDDSLLRGLAKCFVSLALLFIAIAKVGPSIEGWLIVMIAGSSGMLWQSAKRDVFGLQP